MSDDGRPGPLSGVKVLEFSEILAGPYGGMLLADMGADVIKVEPPGGEPWRAFQPLGMREGRGYIGLNRGKRGIVLDLNAPEGRQVAQEIADRSDVVLINYRPDVSAKLGIDYDTLSARNPRLVYCDNTAFGRRGPHAHRPGYDLIAQALTGLMTVEGRHERDEERRERDVPMVNGHASADISTGIAMAWGICAALYVRERTGRGQRVDTTLMSTALAIQLSRFMSIEAVDTDAREAALARIDELRHSGGTYREQLDVVGAIHPVVGNIYYRCYRTADGFLAVGCLSTSLRKRLLAATGLEDWRIGRRLEEIDPTLPHVREHGRTIVAQAEALFATKTNDEWLRILDRHGVPAGPLKFTEELFDDPQVLENGFVTTVEHSMMGTVRMSAPPIQMSETPLRAQASSPTLGQHTEDVLRELGYDDARVADLRDRGILGKQHD